MTLFLVRPNDQTLQAEFSRSNILCQVNRRSGGGTTVLMLLISERAGRFWRGRGRRLRGRQQAREQRGEQRGRGRGAAAAAPHHRHPGPARHRLPPLLHRGPHRHQVSRGNIWIHVEKYLLTLRLLPAPPPTGPSCRRCGLSPPTCPPSRWVWRRAAAAAWCGPARSRSRGSAR